MTTRPEAMIGHLLSVGIGVALIAAAIAGLLGTVPALLIVTSALLGAVALWTSWLSWRGSRAGWSFLVVLDGVLGFCLLIGVPKIAKLLGVTMTIAVIPVVACAIAATMLLLDGHRERPAPR